MFKISLDFGCERVIEADIVWQDESRVLREVTVCVQHIELVMGFLQHHHRASSVVGNTVSVELFSVEQADLN